MKSYREIADSVFARREQYIAAQRKKKQIVARTTLSVGSVALVSLAGFALYKNGGFRKNLPVAHGTPTTTTTAATTTSATTTDGVVVAPTTTTTTTDGVVVAPTTATTAVIPTGMEDTTTAVVDSDNSDPTITITTGEPMGDLIGILVIDDVTYVQCATDENTYTPAEYLGFAHDYEGTYYQLTEDIVGKVYTTKEDPHVLIVQLSNGGTVVLVAEDA